MKTIRCCKKSDLFPLPALTETGQRRHYRVALERLAFLRRARETGFGLCSITALISLAEVPAEEYAPAHRTAGKRLAAVDW